MKQAIIMYTLVIWIGTTYFTLYRAATAMLSQGGRYCGNWNNYNEGWVEVTMMGIAAVFTLPVYFWITSKILEEKP